MALQAVLDSLDGLSDDLKAHYVEADGKFHLDLGDTARDHKDVQALRKAYDSEKEAGKAAKAAAKKAADDLAEALKGKPDEAALIAERQRLEAERDEWKGKAETLDGKLTGVTRDQALTAALAASGVTDPGLQAGAIAMLRDQIKLVDGKPVVETDMGPKALADHVTHWAAGAGKAFVTPAAGGGATGSTSQNGGKIAGNIGGTREERVQALKAKFPDLQ